MPLSPDFQKLRRAMRKQYGKEKGDEVFWGYVQKHKLDETKPMSDQKAEATASLIPMLDDDVDEGIDSSLNQMGDNPAVMPQPTPTDDPTKLQGLGDTSAPITTSATASDKGSFFSIPAYHVPYVAAPKISAQPDGPINIRALILEEGENVNNWRIPSEEFPKVAEQYKAGRQLRVNHEKSVESVIGKSYNALVLKGTDVTAFLGKQIDGIRAEGLYVGAEFEANPQDPQVRTNILQGYVVTGSIGVDAEALCEECNTPLKAGDDGEMVRQCHHLDAGVYLKNVEGKEYSYVAEPAFEHTQAFPSFAAAVDSRIHKESSLLSSPSTTSQMSTVSATAKAEGKKADAEGDADADADARVAKGIAEGIALYKKGVADAMKFRADDKPQDDGDGGDGDGDGDGDTDDQQASAKADAESEGEADADAESEGEADAGVSSPPPLPGQKPKVPAQFKKRKTDQMSRTGRVATKALPKGSVNLEKIYNPTEAALAAHPEYREIFKAAAEAPGAPEGAKALRSRFA